MLIQSLVESPDHVCCRYRLRLFESALTRAGHTLSYHPYPKSIYQPLIDTSKQADVIVLQRHLPDWWRARQLSRRSEIVLFDFDDAVWLRDSYSPKGLNSPKRSGRFRRLMQGINGVIAGNKYLADAALHQNPSLQISLIPTCVEVNRYPMAQHSPGNCRLVWIGSSSTIQGLERIQSVLETLGKELPGLQLKQICDRFLRFDALEVIPVAWAESTETDEIGSSDIGISWIPDDPWSRGKCGLKVLQYMAAGLPVVANPVGVHPEMIEHGVTGFLVNSPSEWVEAIRLLSQDHELRQRMGSAGRRVVESRYSVEAGARSWLQLLDSFGMRRVSA